MKAKESFQVFLLLLFSCLVILVEANSKHKHSSRKSGVPHLCDAVGESSEECSHHNNEIKQEYLNRQKIPYAHGYWTANNAILTANHSCLPIPSPPTVIDDSHVPLEERLKTNTEKMRNDMMNKNLNGKAVFILGNTGSGKSTVTQLLTGNLSQIFATKPEGSKSYVIFDEDNKIGVATTKSKTLLPEFAVQQESGTVFVDCPGFDDTRDTETDIVGMYFLNFALASVRQAKFLFTVISSVVEPGNDREGFDLLVTHGVTLLKNPNATKPAIGLIVTKVPRADDDGNVQTKDDLLSEFKSFMKGYINTTEEKREQSSTDDAKDFNQRKIDLVNIFLSNLGDAKLPTKVSYMRKPENCGALANLPEMLETREMLTDLYSNNMSYISVSPEDFRISLKTATTLKITQVYIPKASENIREQTVIGMQQISNKIVEKFHHDLDDWEGDPPTTALQQVLDKLKWHVDSIQNNGTNFSRKLFALFTELRMPINDNICITNEITDFEDQLVFYEMVTGSSLDWPPPSWMKPFEEAIARIEKLQKFYEFCENVDQELSTYYKQVILEKLARQGAVTEFQTLKVLDFLKNYTDVSVSSTIFDIFQSHVVNEQDQAYLSGLVKSQIPRVSLTCEQSSANNTMYRLKVTGRNVKLSDIVPGSNVPPPHPWPNACSDITKVDQVSIFAQDTVFFNANIIFDCYKIHLSIIAPMWEVIEASHVDLGCQQVNKYDKDADEGATYGAPGKDGRQGKSGVDSGTFFGMLDQEKNGNRLEISTNGGQGGNGQTGGQGREGTRGRDAIFDDFPVAFFCDFFGSSCGNAKIGKIMSEDGTTKRVGYSDINNGGERVWYYIHGYSGGQGGNGGRGGGGGTPGKPGIAQIIAAEKINDSFKITSRPGDPGQGGKGGAPGKGGLSGSHYSCVKSTVGLSVKWKECFSLNSTMRTAAGDTGKDGDQTSATLPNEQVPLGFVPWKLINEYKSMFERSKFNFSSKLDTHSDFLQLQTPLSLAEELVAVEMVYYKERRTAEKASCESQRLHDLDFYERFLQRIKSYATKSAVPGITTEEDKVTLNYIYVTVLSKVVALRQNLMSSAKIIDTELYFKSVEKTLAALKEAETDKKISDESLRYKRQLDKKIEEANRFIEMTVLPAIDKTEETLDKLNNELAKEVQQWLEKAKDDEMEMKRLKMKIEAQMPLRYFFGGIKVIGTALQFLGPVGKTVGTVVSEVGGVAANLSIDSTKPPEKSFDLASAFSGDLKKHSKRYYEKKIEAAKNQVNATKQACDEEGPDLANLKAIAEKAEKAVSAFEKMVKFWNDKPEEILKKEKELTDAQNKLEEEVEKESKITKKDVVKHLNNVFKLAGAGIDMWKDILAAKEDIQKMEKLVEGAGKMAKKAEAKQTALYDDFIPLLEEAMGDIHAAGKSLEGQSLVGLSVKRWKVQEMLEDMQNTMKNFTHGLEVENDFLGCVETIIRAVSLLIELYDHIERYEERKELADYIANIMSVQNAKDLIHDEQLRKAITELELLMQANLFLEEYQVAMSAFKQWVFPFPKKYLASDNEELEMAKLLEMNKTLALDQILSIYKNKVTLLSSTILNYRAITERGDELLMITSFEHNLTSSRPFFTWKNEKWHNMIRDLLSGKTVQLKADLDLDTQQADMFRGKSAFKYKCIRLRLRATNPNHQTKLDDLLKKFFMRMEHSGISEYRVLERKYVMFDSNQTYVYSFEDVRGQPVTSNVVKEKICKSMDYLMSPYTWWTFRLIPATNAVGKAEFDELLRKYGSEVNLDLEGDGMFLYEKFEDPQKLKDLELDQFYQSYDDTSLIEFGGRPTRECADTRAPDGPIIYGLNTCPRGENFACFKSEKDRDRVARERQWIIFWVLNPYDQLECYCSRQ